MVTYMATRTTIYLEGDEYERLKALARRDGRPAAELMREAVREYNERHGGRVKPSSIGKGRSGRADLSESAEKLLSGLKRR